MELPANVVATLREHRCHQAEQRLANGPGWPEEDFVFTTAAGRPLDSRNLTTDFQEELARAGLPRIRWHDLRHTTATLLLEGGEDLGVVSRILGHSDYSTTSDVYAHLSRRMLGRAASHVETAMKGTAIG